MPKNDEAIEFLKKIRECVNKKTGRENKRKSSLFRIRAKSSTDYDTALTYLNSAEKTSDKVTLKVITNLAKLFIYSSHKAALTSKLKSEMLGIHNGACIAADDKVGKISPEQAYTKTTKAINDRKFITARKTIEEDLQIEPIEEKTSRTFRHGSS